MMDEISDLISDISATAKSSPDHVVDFKSIFTVSVINILWAIIGGKRFQRDDPKFKKLLDNIDQFLGSGNAAQANLPVPAFLVRLFPSLPRRLGLKTHLFVPIQQFIEVGVCSTSYPIFTCKKDQMSQNRLMPQILIPRRPLMNTFPPDPKEMLHAIILMSTWRKWRSN